MDQKIRKYYELIDKFLLEQFEMAMGRSNLDLVSGHQKNLVKYLESIKFENFSYEAARIRNIDMLNGVSTMIGFAEYKELPFNNGEKLEALKELRNKIDVSLFLPALNKFSSLELDLNGLNLSEPPLDWLVRNNLKLSSNICPKRFKEVLFEISGFVTDFDYNCQISPESAGFFMVTLHLKDMFCIGYRPATTLFELSALAHEIGHTTTLRKSRVNERFIEVEKDKAPINNEIDSYKYEYLFAKNIQVIIEKIGINLESKGLETLLFKRKSIQYNLHLVANKLNQMYFSGLESDVIQSKFIELMKKVYPSYTEVDNLDWLEFATLAKPISRLGYLEAYQAIFTD
ncbi:MAG: hypothetical protein ACI9QD_000338 [Thermoproteota archaeon]|jgi:hypothetical protein